MENEQGFFILLENVVNTVRAVCILLYNEGNMTWNWRVGIPMSQFVAIPGR